MKIDVFPDGEFFDLAHRELRNINKLGTMLEEVDKLLSRYGLEVTIVAATGDDYDFAILPRVP